MDYLISKKLDSASPSRAENARAAQQSATTPTDNKKSKNSPTTTSHNRGIGNRERKDRSNHLATKGQTAMSTEIAAETAATTEKAETTEIGIVGEGTREGITIEAAVSTAGKETMGGSLSRATPITPMCRNIVKKW